MSEAARPAGLAGPAGARPAGARPAGPVEVWAARAWNVFNEGRPFSVVYPLLVLLAAAPLGLAPEGSLGLALAGAGASRARPVALLVRAAWPGAALARRAGGAAASGAVASAGAARGCARRLRVLHRRRVGLGLLPPAHRSAVDEWAAVLAPRAHELGPHQRQRARAAAEAPDRAERGHAAGGGPGRRLARAGGRRRGNRRGPGRARRALLRTPPPALSAAGPERACEGGARGGRRRPAGLCDRRGRLQPRPPLAVRCAGDGPACARGHGVPRGRAGVSGPYGRLLLVDAHRRHSSRARHAFELRSAARRAAASPSSTC